MLNPSSTQKLVPLKACHPCSAKCVTVHSDALFTRFHPSTSIILSGFGRPSRGNFKGLNIFLDRTVEGQGCRPAFVFSQVFLEHHLLACSMVRPLPASMWRGLQHRLLEAFNSCRSLRRTELSSVRCYRESTCRLVPSRIPDEDSDHCRVLRSASSEEAFLNKVALVILLGYRRWHRASSNVHLEHRTQRDSCG